MGQINIIESGLYTHRSYNFPRQQYFNLFNARAAIKRTASSDLEKKIISSFYYQGQIDKTRPVQTGTFKLRSEESRQYSLDITDYIIEMLSDSALRDEINEHLGRSGREPEELKPSRKDMVITSGRISDIHVREVRDVKNELRPFSISDPHGATLELKDLFSGKEYHSDRREFSPGISDVLQQPDSLFALAFQKAESNQTDLEEFKRAYHPEIRDMVYSPEDKHVVFFENMRANIDLQMNIAAVASFNTQAYRFFSGKTKVNRKADIVIPARINVDAILDPVYHYPFAIRFNSIKNMAFSDHLPRRRVKVNQVYDKSKTTEEGNSVFWTWFSYSSIFTQVGSYLIGHANNQPFLGSVLGGLEVSGIIGLIATVYHLKNKYVQQPW
ncbi:MAG: hypothetical protein GXP63_05370 [DPANN group archaeon]|nr:hypothetical protein [DPANN group archaeon]